MSLDWSIAGMRLTGSSAYAGGTFRRSCRRCHPRHAPLDTPGHCSLRRRSHLLKGWPETAPSWGIWWRIGGVADCDLG